ncbi:hypothetical protein C7C46_00715 [Streptomyces tateyamensis]|uniref:Gram-positive cocci surface proteins LPxTG domain-containing protein n=1 Tax=Streptomyces tateyamensis TaxID=565073 RepID=A0A2V4P0P6_9ACTN|nr:hypothetical protein [Streptomyces tateyamensis]PYC88207.1 hypothetical protein C7C46_00715 [Streptomyces tateyamensis]
MSELHGQRRVARRAGAFGTAVAATAALAWLPSPAFAAPGDNGDVKIHKTTESQGDTRNEPKVCGFYLDAFNFDTLTLVTWTIHQQPPTGTAQVLAGDVVLASGAGRTADLSLPDGHYKLEWTFAGEHGNAKQKVFDVDCQTPTGTPTPTPTSGGPGGPGGSGQEPGSAPVGSVATGTGGSVRGLNAAQLVGGGALIAASGWLALRARRRARRNDVG